MIHNDYLKAILYLIPGAKFSLTGDDYSGIIWEDDRPQPSEAELEQALTDLSSKGVDPLKGEDWDGLQDSLRNTPLFAKAITTSNANGFSLLLSTLATTHNIADLNFALSAVRSGLNPDYTSDEINQMNALLVKYGINLTIK